MKHTTQVDIQQLIHDGHVERVDAHLVVRTRYDQHQINASPLRQQLVARAQYLGMLTDIQRQHQRSLAVLGNRVQRRLVAS